MAAVAQMDRYESYLVRCGTRSPQSRPRGVALSVEPPLGVRPTLPGARGSSQLAASAESLVTDAERSNRRVTCLLHIISDVTRVCLSRVPPAVCPWLSFAVGELYYYCVYFLIRYNLSAFFVTPPLPAPPGVVASTRLCCLSRVPPAVCPSLLSTTTAV